jgi:hypothetical protein
MPTGENRSTPRKPCCSATTNRIWTGLGSSPGIRWDKINTNRLSQARQLIFFCKIHVCCYIMYSPLIHPTPVLRPSCVPEKVSAN